MGISSVPSGATIYLDNVYQGVTPQSLENIPFGSHVVKLTLGNYQDWSDNVELTAASPTASVNAVLKPVPPTYSITVVESFRSNMSDLRPLGTEVGDTVASTLNSAGWVQKFYHKDYFVTEQDFGILDAPLNQGLDESILHYHFGHGSKDRGLVLVKPNEIGDIPLVPRDFLQPIQVANKWDYKNKWVIFDACELVGDPRWRNALVTSHGILGFQTPKTPDSQLPSRFFQYAMNEDRTVGDAWIQATQDLYYKTGIIAAYRFDNKDQLDRDHLPGHGEMAPDEYPDDYSTYYWQWEC